MLIRIQNSEISIQGLQVQYSTFHSSRIKIQVILLILLILQSENRLLLQLFISENDPCEAVALQSTWRLPVASFHFILHEEIQVILPVLILHPEDKELFE